MQSLSMNYWVFLRNYVCPVWASGCDNLIEVHSQASNWSLFYTQPFIFDALCTTYIICNSTTEIVNLMVSVITLKMAYCQIIR